MAIYLESKLYLQYLTLKSSSASDPSRCAASAATFLLTLMEIEFFHSISHPMPVQFESHWVQNFVIICNFLKFNTVLVVLAV